jgi:hypothetical protein
MGGWAWAYGTPADRPSGEVKPRQLPHKNLFRRFRSADRAILLNQSSFRLTFITRLGKICLDFAIPLFIFRFRIDFKAPNGRFTGISAIVQYDSLADIKKAPESAYLKPT